MEVNLINSKYRHHTITTSYRQAIILYEKHRTTGTMVTHVVSAPDGIEVFRYYDISWRKKNNR